MRGTKTPPESKKSLSYIGKLGLAHQIKKYTLPNKTLPCSQSTCNLTSDISKISAKRKRPQEKEPGGRSKSEAHIRASASCKCKATHVRKVRNSNIVQIPRETATAGYASQKTGHRAAVVLLWPPERETEQRKPKPEMRSKLSEEEPWVTVEVFESPHQ